MGRRQALRFLAVGAVAAGAAACRLPGGGAGPRSLREFAAGDWEAAVDGQRVALFTIGPDGSWSTRDGAVKGRWELGGGGLRVVADDDGTPYLMPGVSRDADTALSGSYTVLEAYSGAPVQDVVVSSDRDVVRINFRGRGQDGQGAVMTLTRIV